jgi:hypothetical protein
MRRQSGVANFLPQLAFSFPLGPMTPLEARRCLACNFYRKFNLGLDRHPGVLVARASASFGFLSQHLQLQAFFASLRPCSS